MFFVLPPRPHVAAAVVVVIVVVVDDDGIDFQSELIGDFLQFSIADKRPRRGQGVIIFDYIQDNSPAVNFDIFVSLQSILNVTLGQRIAGLMILEDLD